MIEGKYKELKIKKEGLIQGLKDAYRLLYDKDPKDLQNWEIARAIVESLDDQSKISIDLAKECIFQITNGVMTFPSYAIKEEIVSMAEEMAYMFFPKLAGIQEVHMADIEREYFNWRFGDKNN